MAARLHAVPRSDEGERPDDDTCYLCHRKIDAGDSVVFTEEGVAHAECFVNDRHADRGSTESTATG